MDTTRENMVQGVKVESLPFADCLSRKEQNMLIESSSLVDYARRDTLLKQNGRVSHLAYVQSGLVKISREMRKGKHIILRIAQTNEFIGLASIYGSETYEYSASALDQTTIRFIDNTAFNNLIRTNHEFGKRVIEQIARDNLFNIGRLSSLLYKQLPGRVADIILYFSEEIFNSTTFRMPLTRQELAELAGTTKESLIRTLSEFRNDKIIDMSRSQITIVSMNIVKTLSRLG